MDPNETPIEDPYRRVRRVTPTRPTRRIGQPSRPPEAARAAARFEPRADRPILLDEPQLSVPILPVEAQAVERPGTGNELAGVAEPAQKTIEISLPVIDPIPDRSRDAVSAAISATARDRTSDGAPEPVRRPRTRAAAPEAVQSIYSSAIVITVLSASLLGYAFNIASIQATAQAALRGVSQTGPGGRPNPALSNLVTGLTLLPVAILFLAIMKTLAVAIGLAQPKQKKAERQRTKRPMDAFKKAVGHYGITPRVACQAFQLLQPYVAEGETPRHSLTLEGDLGMTAAEVREMHLALLRSTDREADPAARLPAASTILDLLTLVQRAPQAVRRPLPPVFEPGDPGQLPRRR